MLNRLRARLAADEGISLVETLVAVTLLAVGMAAVLSGILGSLVHHRDDERRILASQIGNEELERLRAIPFDAWVTNPAGLTRTVNRTATGQACGTTSAASTGAQELCYTVTTVARWVRPTAAPPATAPPCRAASSTCASTRPSSTRAAAATVR